MNRGARRNTFHPEVFAMAAANPNNLKKVKEISRREALLAIARQPNSSRLFLGASDFKVYDLDLAQAKPEPRELGRHASYVTGLALAGKTLVSGGYDGRLIWWDVESRAQVRAVEAHKKWIRRVLATRDGKTIVSVADDMACRVWDAAGGKLLHELRGHKEKTPHHFPSMLHACTLSADGKYVATGDKVGHVVVWELASGKAVTTLEAPVMYTWDPVQRRHSIGGTRALAFSPDCKLLAVGGMGKVGNIDHLDGKARVEVFDWQRGERTHEFPGDKVKGLVEQLEFHPQGDWLLAAGGAGDGFLMFFDLKEKKKVLRQEKVPTHIHGIVLNEACDTVHAACHGRLVIFEMKA
jgi:WD40 repeat protein